MDTEIPVTAEQVKFHTDWYCEIYQCRMKREQCFQQKVAATNAKKNGSIYRYPACADCNTMTPEMILANNVIEQRRCNVCKEKKDISKFRASRKSPTRKIKICMDCESKEPINNTGRMTFADPDAIADMHDTVESLIQLRFEDHLQLLEKLRQKAAKEFRSVDNQILYMISKGMENEDID